MWYRPNTLRMLSQREFLQLQSVELGQITHTLNCEGFGGFYSSIELTFISWRRRYFLVEKILINTCILRDSSLVGIPLIRVKRRMQDVSMYKYSWRPSQATLGLSIYYTCRSRTRRCFVSCQYGADEPRSCPLGKCCQLVKRSSITLKLMTLLNPSTSPVENVPIRQGEGKPLCFCKMFYQVFKVKHYKEF